jgi:hypothetical protein
VEEDEEAEPSPKIMGEIRHAAAAQNWKLFSETIKTKDAKHLMFAKSLMDGSINTELIRNWQNEDDTLKAQLDAGEIAIENRIMMKAGRNQTQLLALPDWIGLILAENLHYRVFNHLPATVSNFLYTPSLKQIIEKVCAGCGLCILESKVMIGKGLGDTIWCTTLCGHDASTTTSDGWWIRIPVSLHG